MYIKQDKRIGNIAKRYHKTKNINLRVTPGEHERIRKLAASQRLSITGWFEQLIFGKEEEQ